VERLSDVVKDSGGGEQAEEVRECTKPGIAAQKAGARFVARRCFLICDDLWETKNNPIGFIADLHKLIEQSTGSCTLHSTRTKKTGRWTSRQSQVDFFCACGAKPRGHENVGPSCRACRRCFEMS
jgi:hypothetical protein